MPPPAGVGADHSLRPRRPGARAMRGAARAAGAPSRARHRRRSMLGLLQPRLLAGSVATIRDRIGPTGKGTPVPPADAETPGCSLRGEGRGRKPVLPDGAGRPESVPLDEPGRVVGLAELQQRLPPLLDGVEAAEPQ